MALGTITVSDYAGRGSAPTFFDAISFAGDGAYPTGGSAGLEAALEAKVNADRTILAVLPIDCGGYLPAFDKATGKLKFYYGDNNNAGDGPAVEVPNATDLSAVTMKVLVVSR